MSNITTIATLATPQTILGSTYDSITVNPQIQINYQTDIARVQVSLISTADVTGSHPIMPVSKTVNLTLTAFDFETVFNAAIAASGYAVV